MILSHMVNYTYGITSMCTVPCFFFFLTSLSINKSSLYSTAKIEIRECVKWSLARGLIQWNSINRQAQKVVAVAYRRWSFTRVSNVTLSLEKFWRFGLAVDRLREVVAKGGSTVFINTTNLTPNERVLQHNQL